MACEFVESIKSFPDVCAQNLGKMDKPEKKDMIKTAIIAGLVCTAAFLVIGAIASSKGLMIASPFLGLATGLSTVLFTSYTRKNPYSEFWGGLQRTWEDVTDCVADSI